MDNICYRNFYHDNTDKILRISNFNFKSTPLKSIISTVLSFKKILDEI